MSSSSVSSAALRAYLQAHGPCRQRALQTATGASRGAVGALLRHWVRRGQVRLVQHGGAVAYQWVSGKPWSVFDQWPPI